MSKLLFEIGLEELPASFISPALNQLKNNLEKQLKELNISYSEINTYATPRRLSVIVSELAKKQNDIDEEIKGPPKRIALDENDDLTRAGLGFMKKFNASEDDLVYKNFNGQEYLYLNNHIEGKETKVLLPDILTSLIESLNFPKPMRWGDNETKFGRPIRWLIALLDNELIDFNYAKIKTGNLTKGHRFLSEGQIEVDCVDNYLSILEDNYVIVDINSRKEMILEQINSLENAHNFNVVIDKWLIEEVVNLLEYPTAFVGNFDKSYLELPEEVIITPMKDHQRYFPVKDKNKALLPHFIGVRNGNEDYIENVISGNEKVLVARLADAKFFYQEDLKKPLESYNEKLKTAIFQEDIGTIYQKVERVKDLSLFIDAELNLTNIKKDTLVTAANLIKTDLATQMVYEFPELQGIMGEKYALAQGYDQSIASAISEHYMPTSSDGDLPFSDYGAILAIADKIDTIVSCLAVGLSASGSQDPYGLRRQAAGIARIMVDREYRIDLYQLFSISFELLEKSYVEKEALWEEFWNFFKARIRNVFDEFSYDIFDSILETDNYIILDIFELAKSLTEIKKSEKYSSLIAGYKRANNLAEKAEKEHALSKELLRDKEEIELFDAYMNIKPEFLINVKNLDYTAALSLFSTLENKINQFFDNVMVMVDDKELRSNRLALLQSIVDLIKPISDLSKLVE
ncbi:MAG: glycine--tRNA ligase subunit beta [Clostridia bacterium]